MNKELISLIVFITLFAIILIGGSAVFIQQHENAHKVIFRYAGVNSHIEYKFPMIETIPDTNFANAQLKEQAYISHAINESVGYQLLPSVLMICATLVLCTLYLSTKQ